MVARIMKETFFCGEIKSTRPGSSAGNPINIITAFFINERRDKVTHVPSRAAALSSQDHRTTFRPPPPPILEKTQTHARTHARAASNKLIEKQRDTYLSLPKS